MSRKKINQSNSDIYGELVDFQGRLHAQNLKRIHIGLLCVLIIPMIFLSLMFITDSNKVIWLILWIVSLFAISSYLIVVEYGDYNLQHRINSITGSDAEPVPLLESGINDMNGKIASVKAEARDIIASAKASMNVDENGSESADTDEYTYDIDTDMIKESLNASQDALDDADEISLEKVKNKDKKKDKKKSKDKDKKKDKDKRKAKKSDKKEPSKKKDKDKKNKKKNKKSKKSADTDNGSKNIAKEDAFDE